MQNKYSTCHFPYQFDTLELDRRIVRAAVGFQVFIVFSGIYLLAFRGISAFLPLVLVFVIISFFIRLFVRHAQGALGTITADEVVVQASKFWEFYISTPSRRIPLNEFQKIMVEIIPSSVQAERILLIGKFGNPDILLARTNRGDGRILGKDLSCLLGIPYDEQLCPY